MSLLKKGTSAIGKLLAVAVLAVAFFVGLVGVVYMSLQGEELTVPEIVGKDFIESEKELAMLGLKIKKRADRYSKEKQNTVLEQRPKAGEVVKTGQMVLVVVSKEDPDGKEAPATIESDEQEDIEKIEELISDKPKTSSKKTSTSDKKKTRDVKVEKKDDEADKENTADGDSSDKSGDTKTEKTTAPTGDKPKSDTPVKTDTDKKSDDKPKPPKTEPPKPKPQVDKPKGNGDTRPRTTPVG